MGEVEVGLDIDPELGTADSGDLEHDLPNLFVVVAEAAQERHIPPTTFARSASVSNCLAPTTGARCSCRPGFWRSREPRRARQSAATE